MSVCTPKSFDLTGKVALVTGASYGIGFAIATAMANCGAKIVFNDIKQELVDKGLAAYKEAGIDAHGYVCDVTNEDAVNEMVKKITAEVGHINVLVNNAGVAPEKRMDLLEMTEESYDRVVSINAKGTLFFTQAVARQMCTQEIIGSKRGTIINISSCSAEVVSRSRGEYCISKAGISMITKLFAERLAGDGILVHEVRPGIISTDMTSAVKDKYDRLIREGCFPIARWGKPEDVANAVSALAGDGFLYTTGNYIDIDGGYHIKTL